MKEVRYVELVGDRYGRLVVLERAPTQSGKTRWLCRCDCGNETVVMSQNLRDGGTKSCGCFFEEFASSVRSEMVGLRFGSLVVKARAETDKVLAHWRCICDCGKEHVARGASLRAGHTTSCGCAKRLCGKVRKPVTVGEVFGRLTVARQEESSKQGARWLCSCTCGGWVVARGKDLRGGNTKSCGCLKRESSEWTKEKAKQVFSNLTAGLSA